MSGVLVPVKAFGQAKRRLSAVLDPQQRADLARTMATTVVRAAHPLPVAVVCDDLEVAAWAESEGALVVWAPGLGLNRAVQAGVERLAGDGAVEVIVAHSDLPLARDLPAVAGFSGVTLVPDARRTGTNVICVPAGSQFCFSYGPGSFPRHQAEANRLGLALRVVEVPWLTHDVDRPADLVTTGLSPGR